VAGSDGLHEPVEAVVGEVGVGIGAEAAVALFERVAVGVVVVADDSRFCRVDVVGDAGQPVDGVVGVDLVGGDGAVGGDLFGGAVVAAVAVVGAGVGYPGPNGVAEPRKKCRKTQQK
jgi:hypothetical protein